MPLFELLPGLACAAVMALAMWFVTRPSATVRSVGGPERDQRQRLADLEDELERLRAARATPPGRWTVASGSEPGSGTKADGGGAAQLVPSGQLPPSPSERPHRRNQLESSASSGD